MVACRQERWSLQRLPYIHAHPYENIATVSSTVSREEPPSIDTQPKPNTRELGRVREGVACQNGPSSRLNVLMVSITTVTDSRQRCAYPSDVHRRVSISEHTGDKDKHAAVVGTRDKLLFGS